MFEAFTVQMNRQLDRQIEIEEKQAREDLAYTGLWTCAGLVALFILSRHYKR